MKKIPLTQGQYALVDDSIYDELIKHKWCATYRKGTGVFYAIRRLSNKEHNLNKTKYEYMHRRIANCKYGLYVDHINSDTLDNRSKNLRVCTNSQNGMNRGKAKHNTSGYKGVIWSKQKLKWQSRITINNKQIHLGFFIDILDAHHAYCEASKKYHGEFGRTK